MKSVKVISLWPSSEPWDALWQEKDGKWQAVHSCGHDSHSTMALGVIKLFNKIGYQPPGKLKVIFQPAAKRNGCVENAREKGLG